MPALSQPPRLLIGFSGNLHRAKPTVLRGMPFGGQTWIHRDEVVNAFDDMNNGDIQFPCSYFRLPPPTHARMFLSTRPFGWIRQSPASVEGSYSSSDATLLPNPD